MKTKYLSILFAAFATLGTTVSTFAQYGGRGYSSNVAPTIDTQRQAQQSATRATTGVTKRQTSQTPSIPQTRLVAFGVDIYPFESKLSCLDGCVNDANAFVQTFDYAISSVLTDEKATYSAILDELQQVADDARYGRLIVFFGGHGVNVDGRSFLCPFDAVAGDALSALEKSLSETDKKDDAKIIEEGKKYGLIPLAYVLNVLKSAKAKEVLVVLDACRDIQDVQSGDDSDEEEEVAAVSPDSFNVPDQNGDFMLELVELGKKNNSFRRSTPGAFVVLTSCSRGQKASEYAKDERVYGRFAYFLLDGIKSGLADYAGLGDGCVTLVEAYNYAFSNTMKDSNGFQAPERYMSSVSNNFILKINDDPERQESESDLQFIARTGKILANLKWSSGDNKVGLKALDCYLENVPNDVSARACRASVRRKLGDYAGALDDYTKISEKFQLYAVSNKEIQDNSTSEQIKGIDEVAVHEYDLLTITRIGEDGRYFVSEVNDNPSKSGWLDPKLATWSLAVNGTNIATATPTQNVRTTIPNMISTGRDAVTGARPFVGTLGF